MTIARPVALLTLVLAAQLIAGGRAALAGEVAPGEPRLESVLEPMRVSPAMQAWAARMLGPTGGGGADRLFRLRHLLALLTQAGPERIEELVEPTPTAQEAFVAHRADCLGFAMLFVALARERGIGAGFTLALEGGRDEVRGGLRIRRGHFAASFGGRVFDQGGERRFDPARDTEVSDRTAVALFLSNRGAQSLVAGDQAEAVELLYRAVRFDPSIPYVWSNLGVALDRAGDAAGAVLAHEMALRLDPADVLSARNLALVRTRAGGPLPHSFSVPRP